MQNGATGTAMPRILGEFLPAQRAHGQVSAQSSASAKTAFDRPGIAGNVACVAGRPYNRTAAGHYRYPSLNGRSDVPKVRPSALFSQHAEIPQNQPLRPKPAEHDFAMELSGAPSVNQSTCIDRGVTERCAEQKSSPWHLLVSRALRLAAALSGNKPLSAAQPALAPQQSRVATSAPVPSSVAQRTLPIASRTPAPAGASTDLTDIARRVRPSGHIDMNPAAAGLRRGFCMQIRSGTSGTRDWAKSRGRD